MRVTASGETALTRTLRGPASSAQPYVSEAIAPLVAVYAEPLQSRHVTLI
jgi:hypothetical protein